MDHSSGRLGFSFSFRYTLFHLFIYEIWHKMFVQQPHYKHIKYEFVFFPLTPHFSFFNFFIFDVFVVVVVLCVFVCMCVAGNFVNRQFLKVFCRIVLEMLWCTRMLVRTWVFWYENGRSYMQWEKVTFNDGFAYIEITYRYIEWVDFCS